MKLFKRSPDLQANLYCRFMVRSKVYLWCTKTNDPVTARRRARDYREAIITASYGLANKMKSRSECVTYREVFDCYETLPLDANEKSRAGNIKAMERVLKANGLNEASRVDTLAAKLGIVYQQKELAAGANPVTINGNIRFAKAVFSRKAMLGYKAMGLEISRDWKEDFFEVGALPEPEQRLEIPTAEQVDAVHAALSAPDADKGAYRAFLLAAYAGLRAGELVAARWDWIEGDVLYVGGREFVAKSGRWRAIRMDPAVLAELVKGDKDGDLIAGAFPDTAVNTHLLSALHGAGFTALKPIHSLRRLYGSKVAMASGLFAAQHALGHASPTTTSKHYARMLTLPAAVGIVPAVTVGA